MEITEIPVTGRYPNLKEVKGLYYRAFPAAERLPHWLLRLMCLWKGFSYTAYYDGNTFCGLTFVISNDSDAFVFYLAFNDQIRSKGYGTAILENLKATHQGKQISLNIEPLEPPADNQEQRERRLRFYRRNGFFTTGFQLKNGGETYWVLSNRRDFDLAGYQRVIKKLSFGLPVAKISRM